MPVEGKVANSRWLYLILESVGDVATGCIRIVTDLEIDRLLFSNALLLCFGLEA